MSAIKLKAGDLSNNPFVRPELEALASGLEWIRNPDNHYPIRGTYNAQNTNASNIAA